MTWGSKIALEHVLVHNIEGPAPGDIDRGLHSVQWGRTRLFAFIKLWEKDIYTSSYNPRDMVYNWYITGRDNFTHRSTQGWITLSCCLGLFFFVILLVHLLNGQVCTTWRLWQGKKTSASTQISPFWSSHSSIATNIGSAPAHSCSLHQTPAGPKWPLCPP